MISRPARRKRSRFNPAVILFGASLCGVAFSLSRPVHSPKNFQARSFSKGISIEVDRSSPTFAAMEDSILEEKALRKNSPAAGTLNAEISHEPLIGQMLVAGRQSAEAVFEKISDDNFREDARVEQAIAKAAKENAQQDVQRRLAVQSDVPADQPATSRVQTISLNDLKISRDQLLRELLAPIAKPSQPEEPLPIQRRISAPPSNPSSQVAQSEGDSARANFFRKPPISQMGTTSVGIAEKVDHAFQPPTSATLHQILVSGPLEFTQGLALTSASDRVVVFRESDGEVIESGTVWLKEGRYEVFLDEGEGLLVGELRNAQGDVLGRGELELNQLPAVATNQVRVDAVTLKMSPVPQGLTGRVNSAYSTVTKNVAIANARIAIDSLSLGAFSNKDGTYQEENLMNGSSVVIRATRASHWGTLALANVGTQNQMILFPDKMITAFTRLISPEKAVTAADSAVIWGRVLKGGQPVAGAQVELMTTPELVRPVYFNSMMIPDPSLTSTSENGVYAFFPVAPGAHAVQATYQGNVGDPRVFPTDAHHVSYNDIEVASVRTAKFKVFDAFRTDWPLAAEVVPVGTTHGLVVPRSGELEWQYIGGPGQLILDVDGGRAYEHVRMAITRDHRVIAVPMIQSAWMDKVRGALRINGDPQTGAIVGFVQGEMPYRASLGEDPSSPNMRVVYFDRNGEVTRDDYGSPGGGFVIFNAAEGFRTVVLQLSGTSKVFATSLLVDQKVTNVISKSMR